MSFRRRGSFRRRNNMVRPVVNSIKNDISFLTGLTAGANTVVNLAIAEDAPTTADADSVRNGSLVKAIWLEFWVSNAATHTIGVSTAFEAYIMKNPGNNLTGPVPGTVGTSNEKKFVIKGWKGLTGDRLAGFPAYSWKGWIKIPKRYHRMGTDDKWQLNVLATGVDQILCLHIVYKWYF